jgi:hypothetical protein
MSRGPGRIERAIRALFDANPDLAFVTDELAEHCYPGVPVERKHQVAVLRAAQAIIEGDPDWRAWRIEGQGRGWVFLNHASMQSYALARLIGDQSNVYRSPRRARRAVGFTDLPLMNGARVRPGNDCIVEIVKGGLRFARVWGNYDRIMFDRDRLRRELGSDRCRERMAPDGAWFRHVQLHCAERDGDVALADALKARQEAEIAAWIGAGKRFAARNDNSKETLTALASRARKLMTQNDPDAVRAGLAEIAAQLEAMARPEG